MADLPPAGGSSGDDPDDKGNQNPFAGTPFEQIFSSLARGDTSGLQAMFGQMQRMFTPHEGTVNWDLTRDLARQVVAQEKDRSPDAGDVSRLRDTAQLAEHWLDAATELPAGSTAARAWSKAEWVEESLPVWKQIVEPIAGSVVSSMQQALPSEAQSMAGPMLGMLNQIGGAMFSQQVGQAVGQLSTEVLSATDIGFPVGTVGTPALVLANARTFGEGLGLEESDVLLYLMLRECAHQRLYAHAPWLREHLFSLIAGYGRGITVDTSRIENAMGTLDPTNMEAVQEALSGGLFDIEQTPEQQAALRQLETVLALIEGWVDDVVHQAAGGAMASLDALQEAMRRRRATGGPAEQTFAALVGLELRPRRLRDAATLWGALRAAEGASARDAVWAHQELLPTSSDLDDPLSYAQRTKEADSIDIESAEFDAALTALLEGGGHGDSDATDTEGEPAGDTDTSAEKPDEKDGEHDGERPENDDGPPSRG